MIGDQGAVAISKALKGNITLCTLRCVKFHIIVVYQLTTRSMRFNSIGHQGATEMAKAVAENEMTALSLLEGVELWRFIDLLNISSEFTNRSNEAILSHLQTVRVVNRPVKSARGGMRS
jgi:hypothetical protein